MVMSLPEVLLNDTAEYADQLTCIDSPSIKFTVQLGYWTLDWKSGMSSVWKSTHKGPFYGDSGTPLFCYENERYVAQGITSKGDMTNDISRALSSKISHYLTWIFDIMDEGDAAPSRSTPKPKELVDSAKRNWWWSLLNKHVGIPFARIRNP
uniref:Peptidase S1 domain-containing protein n=1 Tax=Romanomermis culicivorax TaxID=13658 RepID=A0A915KQ23_ROMCU